jgi:hypothetical protein
VITATLPIWLGMSGADHALMGCSSTATGDAPL